MKSRLLGGIAALALAVIGAVLLFVYVQGSAARAQAGMNPVTVLVVQEEVPAGTETSELGDRVKPQSIPKAAVPQGALSNLDDQAGKVTAVDLKVGEQLLASRIVDPKELVPGTVPVPDGLEEVTFLLAPERILGSRIAAGDSVTVFGSFTLDDNVPVDASFPEELQGWKDFTSLQFHDVLVTAVQQAAPETKSGGKEGESGIEMPSGSAYVTVAVADTDAAKLVFTAEFGSMWLAKQTGTTTKNDPPITTLEQVY